MNTTHPDYDRWNARLALCSLLATFATMQLRLGEGLLNDPFHHGEYFAALSSLLYRADFVPLTIHGALDWLPGQAAEWLFGDDRYMLATRVFYIALDLGSALLLFGSVRAFIGGGIALLVASVIIPLVVNYRDFSLLFLAGAYFFGSKPKPANTIWLIVLGLAGAFNFYFSANRGIAGTVAVGSAILLCSYHERKVLLSGGIFLASVLLASVIHPMLDLGDYISNILFLSRTSYQWSYALKGEPLWLTVYMAVLLLLTSLLNIIRVWTYGAADRHRRADLVVILLLSAFYFQIATYRADFVHAAMGLVMVLFSAAHWVSLCRSSEFKVMHTERIVLVVLSALSCVIFYYDKILGICFPAFFLCVFIQTALPRRVPNLIVSLQAVVIATFCLYKGVVGYQDGSFQWLSHAIFKRPNLQTIDASLSWVVERLRERKSACVFDLTNNGLINAAATKPACTRFSYLVYADGRFEEEIINALISKSPSAVVYSTEFWSYAIDGRSMPARFPKLDRRIREMYPEEECKYGYCLRYRS